MSSSIPLLLFLSAMTWGIGNCGKPSYFPWLPIIDPFWLRDFRAQRTPILDCIANNPALQQHTVITTYYQDTTETREISLKEYLECAIKGRRPFVVVILGCSEGENTRRLLGRSPGSKSKLTDVNILKEIRQNEVVYSFYEDGFKSPDVWEYRLDIENTKPKETAHEILELLNKIPRVHVVQNNR